MSIQKSPLVSIIIPIYGVEAYIYQCATSVFMQTYTNIEILFIDDCSKDNSIKILKSAIEQYPQIKEKVKIITHEKNLGLAGARLTGIKNASGEYIIHFDSDDYVENDIIDKLVNTAIKDNSDIVICDFDHVYPDKSKRIYVNPPLEQGKLICKLFTGEVHASLCNKLIKRELYTKNNVYHTVGLNMCEDLSVLYKLVYYSKNISYLPEVLYHYRQVVNGSFTAQKMPLKHQLNRLQLLEQISTFITDVTGDNATLKQHFKYLIAGNKAEMLLYGDLKQLTLFKREDMRIASTDICRHPKLHRNFRIILLLDYYHLSPLVYLIRKLQQVYTKNKH